MGQTSVAGNRRVFSIVNNGFSVQRWDIHSEKLLVGGCGGPKSSMQEHFIMHIPVKQSKHMIKIADSVFLSSSEMENVSFCLFL